MMFEQHAQVSIHASAREATLLESACRLAFWVSIHASAREATLPENALIYKRFKHAFRESEKFITVAYISF